MDPNLFKDKTYVVTGGGTGIGLACVRQLLGYGAYVCAVDITEKTKELEALPQERLTFIKCDVGDRKGCHSVIEEAISKYGHLDGLVNNAAICPTQGELPSDELYDEVFDVNVRGTFNFTSEVVPHMKKNGGGAIVNVGSTSCLVGKRRLPLYAGSKHAVLGLTRSWALDFAQYQIRVNVVAPGGTDTNMGRRPLKAVMGPVYGLDKTEDELLEAWSKSVPMQRIGQPDDMANSVLFLLSDLSSYVTGQIICVSGGS